MDCPECRFSNREGVKFCEECGNRLELICHECNANLPLGTKFCGECGQPLWKDIDSTRAIRSIDAERKHVTVLFTDLVGYTAMAERLDPEESKDILNRIFNEILIANLVFK